MANYNLTVGNDVLIGTEGADNFYGVNSGVTGGTDTLNGGGGDDSFYVGHLAAGTVNGGSGIDTVFIYGGLGTVTYTNVEILSVTEFYVLSGSVSQFASFGRIVDSTDPLRQIPIYLAGAGGTVDVSGRLTGSQSINLTGSDATSGVVITGTANGDELRGSKFNDVLNGGGGADWIGAGDGNDTLNGGDGNDTLSTGGFGADTLNGDAGNDTLSAYNGLANTLNGGAGNDLFLIFGNSGTVDGGAGTDTVKGSDFGNTTFTNVEVLNIDAGHIFAKIPQLASFAAIVNLPVFGTQITFVLDGDGGVLDFSTRVTGTRSVYATGQDVISGITITGTLNGDRLEGSEFNDTLNGGGGDDTLDGGGGDDTLDGGDGADTLYGGGSDVLRGGAGDDRFIILDNTAATIDGGAGKDTIVVTSALGSLTFSNVEVLEIENGYVFASLAHINAFNTIFSTIYPNTVILFNLVGAGGTVDFSDRLTGECAASVDGQNLSSGYKVVGTVNNDFFIGSSFDDVLNGGGGADELVGGFGNDIYYLDNSADVIVEAAGGGTDTARSFVNWTLANNVERLELQGTGNLNGTGNTLNNTLVGNAGNNVLNGGAGNDYMVGGAGNDIFVVAAARDRTVENASGGTDTIRSYINWTLGANVERLELQGTGNLNGAGNSLNNTLVGNVGNNLLNGGAGNDYMVGGAGNDIFVVASTEDRTVENAGGGIDTVRSYIDWTLGGNVERLELQGTGNLNGAGNTANNTLVGNVGNNLLNGGAGNDYMVGGAGNDIFMFDTALGASNVDTVADFNVAADTIRLENAIFSTIAGSGTLTAAQFASNASGTAQDASDRIIYETDTGKLIYDSNGSAAGGAFHFGTLASGLAITNADFFMV
jgi:Ca2+-binding RTX toxin-like protein